MGVGQATGRGARKSARSRETPLPSTEEFDRLVSELVRTALLIRAGYRRELALAMAAAGSSEVRISGGDVSKPTERAWDRLAGPAGRECREVAKAMRDALDSVRYAHGELGGPEQPRRRHPRAVISATEFDHALHKQRERRLRGET